MSLELIRETYKLGQVIGEDAIQSVVENDIIVPDIKPDISRILVMDGTAFVKNTEASHDKVVVEGAIAYRILYVADEAEQKVRSINTSASFSCELDVPYTRPEMKCIVKCEVEHVDYNLSNSRKINAKTVLKVGGKVMKTTDLEVANDIRGIDNIQVLKEGMKLECFIGDNDLAHTVKESLVVPAGKPSIREILRNDVKISGKDFKVTDGKVVAKGDLIVSTLYLGDDESQNIQYMEHEIPFAQFIDIPGITEDDRCDVMFGLGDWQFEPQEDSDGEYRAMEGVINLNIYASGYSSRQVDVISDAYSPASGIVLEKEPVRLEEAVTHSTSQVVLKETASIPEGSPGISEVFNIISRPGISDYKILDNKLVLDGVVTNSILYLSGSAEQPVSCLEQETLFKQNIDIRGIKPGMTCDMDLDVDHCTYSMLSSGEIEVRLVIGVATRFYNCYSVPLVVRASEVALEAKRSDVQPSITIYFAQPGDTLWKIAKKYSTTIDEIIKTNNIAADAPVSAGQQVVIPKRRI